MKIGFIGNGHVAQTVGSALAKRGYEVMLSARNPEKTLQSKLQVGTFREAAQFGEVIFLAIKWEGLKACLRSLDTANVDGKVVIDPTNATRLNTSTNTGELLLSDTSVGEIVQQLLPTSRVVKALNLSVEIDPVREEGVPLVPIAGNDRDAKAQITEILGKLGWHYVADLGSIQQSRPIEALSVLMMDYVFSTQNFKAAFTILRK